MTDRSLMFDGIRVIDNDEGIITVKLTANLGNNKELRGWCYDNDDQRRTKMQLAREYVEGWCDGMDHFFIENPTLYVKWLHLREEKRKEQPSCKP